MSAVRFINETIVTSAVDTVQVDNVFSSDFDMYKITMSGLEIGTDDYTGLRLVSDAGIENDALYDSASQLVYCDQAFFQGKNENLTQFYYLNYMHPAGNDKGNGNVIYVINPFSNSLYTSFLNEGAGYSTSAPRLYGFRGIGQYKKPVSATGFAMIRTGNFDAVKIRTYGIRGA